MEGGRGVVSYRIREKELRGIGLGRRGKGGLINCSTVMILPVYVSAII